MVHSPGEINDDFSLPVDLLVPISMISDSNPASSNSAVDVTGDEHVDHVARVVVDEFERSQTIKDPAVTASAGLASPSRDSRRRSRSPRRQDDRRSDRRHEDKQPEKKRVEHRRRALPPRSTAPCMQNDEVAILLLGAAQRRYADQVIEMAEAAGIHCHNASLDGQHVGACVDRLYSEGYGHLMIIGRDNEKNHSVSFKPLDDTAYDDAGTARHAVEVSPEEAIRTVLSKPRAFPNRPPPSANKNRSGPHTRDDRDSRGARDSRDSRDFRDSRDSRESHDIRDRGRHSEHRSERRRSRSRSRSRDRRRRSRSRHRSRSRDRSRGEPAPASIDPILALLAARGLMPPPNALPHSQNQFPPGAGPHSGAHPNFPPHYAQIHNQPPPFTASPYQSQSHQSHSSMQSQLPPPSQFGSSQYASSSHGQYGMHAGPAASQPYSQSRSGTAGSYGSSSQTSNPLSDPAAIASLLNALGTTPAPAYQPPAQSYQTQQAHLMPPAASAQYSTHPSAQSMPAYPATHAPPYPGRQPEQGAYQPPSQSNQYQERRYY